MHASSKLVGLGELVAVALLIAAATIGCSSDDSAGGAAGSGGAAGGAGTGGSGGSGGAGGAGGGAGAAGLDGGGGSTPDAAIDAPVETQTDAPPEAPPLSWPPPPLALTEVANGLSAPVFVTQAPGDPSRLFVVEQTGTIRAVKGGTVASTPFLDVTDLVTYGGERGLLGLAFHPGYAQNGRFFVHYSGKNGGETVLAEYARADADTAKPAATKIIFTHAQPFSNHNGGMLAFGPDGFLYMGLGDGGSGGDPQGNGQKLGTKLGKILRIDVDAYPTPPAGNLTGGDPAIWDYGLRNPWRFSFDRLLGDLYIGDVGQNAWEEVDVEPKGQGGRNYGWNVMEGTHCYEPASGCDQSGLTLPAVEYDHGGGRCAVTGGYVYRGKAIPALSGTYLYADYCTAQVWAMQWSGGTVAQNTELTSSIDPNHALGMITSFGEDLDGELYVVTQNPDTVQRIDAK